MRAVDPGLSAGPRAGGGLSIAPPAILNGGFDRLVQPRGHRSPLEQTWSYRRWHHYLRARVRRFRRNRITRSRANPPPNWKLKFAMFATTYGDYFRAMGIPLLDGRYFTEDDRADTPLVVIVNQSMAKHSWPGQRAVGKRMHVGNPKKRSALGNRGWRRRRYQDGLSRSSPATTSGTRLRSNPPLSTALNPPENSPIPPVDSLPFVHRLAARADDSNRALRP